MKALIGQIVGHELQEKTESGGRPVKIKVRIPLVVAGEVFKARLEFFVERADLASWPIGRAVEIPQVYVSQTEIEFDAKAGKGARKNGAAGSPGPGNVPENDNEDDEEHQEQLEQQELGER